MDEDRESKKQYERPYEKVKQCARLKQEKTIIHRLNEKLQAYEESLMVDETVSRVLTALHSLTDNELLVTKLKEYRPKTAKWGVDNGKEAMAESFLREDIIMVHSRSLITDNDKDYRTDEEMEKEYQECHKSSPKASDNRVAARKARGKGARTKANEETLEKAELFWEGNSPIPAVQRITPSTKTAPKQGKADKKPTKRTTI